MDKFALSSFFAIVCDCVFEGTSSRGGNWFDEMIVNWLNVKSRSPLSNMCLNYLQRNAH